MKNLKNKVDEFIRVDHAGERGAVKIYEGQLLALNTVVKDNDLEKLIREIDTSLIKEVNTFDVYEGENIPKDKKSVALSITLQSEEKTLDEKDIDQISKKIIEVVKSKTGATIRS